MAENFNNYFVNKIKEIRCSMEDVQYKNQQLNIGQLRFSR